MNTKGEKMGLESRRSTDVLVKRMKDLKERVEQFNMLQLPGQPMGMHMGTSYLVNDLWRELEKLYKDYVSSLDNIAH